MERLTSKTHPEFDLDAATKCYSKVARELTGEQITSPFDLFSVERLRDEHALRRGLAVPTDVFVMGKGPAPNPALTRVSGVPYWPKSKPWPESKDGAPCQFLAQFCFKDSLDLHRKLPGDLLLIFVPQDDEEWLWEPDLIRLEWASTAENPALLTDLPKGVKSFSPSEWYGVIHRTLDYPEGIKPARELEVEQAYDLPVLNGTKIGGIPHGIQEQPKLGRNPVTGQPVLLPKRKGKAEPRTFLCQLTSLQAAPEVPYPWTNRKEPLGLDFDSSGIYCEENDCSFGDMGSIYVYMEPSGRCIAGAESY